MKGRSLHMFTFILLVIGGLNWLLVGAFDWGIAEILGETISRIIYILVGLSAVYEIFIHKRVCKECTSGKETDAAVQI